MVSFFLIMKIKNYEMLFFGELMLFAYCFRLP